MDVALYILALTFALLGIVGAIVPVMPGALLSFTALIFSYFTESPATDAKWLFIWLAISVAVSIADYFLPVYLTKKLGGSKAGVWGATIGMLVGFIAFPPFGIIFGPMLGAVMGELMNDKNNIDKAIQVGFASLVAFIFGTGLKFVMSLYILSLIISSQMENLREFVEWIKGLINF